MKNQVVLSYIQRKELVVPLDKSKNPSTTISLDTSILIGGASGSGKSNLIWTILQGLNDYGIPHRYYVIDPAGGVELSALEHSKNTIQYVDRPLDTDHLIQQAHSHMDSRLSSMKEKGIRLHQPTPEEPLIILIIDELLLLKTVNQDPTTPLGEILAVGRKARFIVIAATQLTQIDAIGRIRDLFPQRVALSTTSQDMTDAILGHRATSAGALAHKIRKPGQGYLFVDDRSGFHRFNSPHITNPML